MNGLACPRCGSIDADRVIETRKIVAQIRRLRRCLRCNKNFATYEQVRTERFYVLKRDGKREWFDKEKLRRGLRLAFTKVRVHDAEIDEMTDRLAEKIQEKSVRVQGDGLPEISSKEIGALVLDELLSDSQRHREHAVAYVRFASVFLYFTDYSEFQKFLGVEVLSPARSRVINPGEPFAILECDKTLSIQVIQRKHLFAISRADFLYVYNPKGYVGTSTTAEIGGAMLINKPIFALERTGDPILDLFIVAVGRPEEITQHNLAWTRRSVVSANWSQSLLPAEIGSTLPPLFATEIEGTDALARVKFFTPDSMQTWYAVEFDSVNIFYGLIIRSESELGYFYLYELENMRGPKGFAVKRDPYFVPTRLSKLY